MNLYDAQFGHVQFFDRDSYIKGGMENENFRGSSPEDKERFYRFKKLGYDVCRLDDYVYHLEHSRGRNSWQHQYKVIHICQRTLLFGKNLKRCQTKKLKNYYTNQPYLKI